MVGRAVGGAVVGVCPVRVRLIGPVGDDSVSGLEKRPDFRSSAMQHTCEGCAVKDRKLIRPLALVTEGVQKDGGDDERGRSGRHRYPCGAAERSREIQRLEKRNFRLRGVHGSRPRVTCRNVRHKRAHAR